MKDILLLHNECDNSVVLVSVDNIVCVDTEVTDSRTGKRCSKIYVDKDNIDAFLVNETPEKIFSMLKKPDNVSKKEKKDNLILS